MNTDARPTFLLDGEEIPFEPGQTVIQAALTAGHYIPHLCYHPEFVPHGSCKLCTVKADGRPAAACTLPVQAGITVESETEELNDLRRTLVQMLFAEGNHFCPACEKSGNCVLQALGCDLGVMTAGFRHFFLDRPVDASHPDLLLDFNRCVLCKLCVRASEEVDGKGVFSLAGCFGCHMSLLDIDERLFALLEKVEFDRTPLKDIKHCEPCDIGIIEGGVCNAENVEVLREFRRNCKILIAMGACAVTGGLPAQRNHLDLGACLQEVYLTEPGLINGQIPNDPELPLPLDKVHPLHEVVKADYFLPGCPPSADAIWKFLTDLIAGRTPRLGHGLISYD